MNGGGCYKCPVNPCETSIYYIKDSLRKEMEG